MIYNPSAKISKHFKQYEIARSQTAARLGYDNSPNCEVIYRAAMLAVHVLDPIREHFNVPISPQSWYRSDELEYTLTAPSFKKWSSKRNLDYNLESTWKSYFELKSHPKGEAVDIEIPGVSNDALYRWIQDNLEFDQLIREFATPGDPMSGWVHVSYSVNHNRNEAFNIE